MTKKTLPCIIKSAKNHILMIIRMLSYRIASVFHCISPGAASAAERCRDKNAEAFLKEGKGEFMKRIYADIRKTGLLWIFSGTALMALSTNLFFSPAGMVPGGFTGLAMLIQHVTARLFPGGIPLWMGNIILNVPLILCSVKIRGWHFMKRTFLAALLFSGWLYIIPEYGFAETDPFLTAVLGGSLLGVGLGRVFFGKATTGGTDTLAALIQHALPHLSAAKILPVLDGLIILLSVWIFGFHISMYAVISVILTGRIADGLIGSFRNAYLAYIISGQYKEIGERILRDMDRGTTLLPGTGMYTGSDRPVLFCAVTRKQAVTLKELVYETDPQAFVILTDASEIRGEGFLRYSREEF